MKAGAMFTTNATTGKSTATDDVVLLCSEDEVPLLFKALGLLCRSAGENSAAMNFLRVAGWGPKTRAGEVIMVISKAEAQIFYDGLDLYCTAHPASKIAKELFHTFGWRHLELLPEGGA